MDLGRNRIQVTYRYFYHICIIIICFFHYYIIIITTARHLVKHIYIYIEKSEIEREVNVLCQESVPLLTSRSEANYSNVHYYEYNSNFTCQQSIIILNKKSSEQCIEEDAEQAKLNNGVAKRHLLENRKHQVHTQCYLLFVDQIISRN